MDPLRVHGPNLLTAPSATEHPTNMDANVPFQPIYGFRGSRNSQVRLFSFPIKFVVKNNVYPDSSKLILPLVCYVFQDGPWRDTLVRFGYDPRKDVEARLYDCLSPASSKWFLDD